MKTCLLAALLAALAVTAPARSATPVRRYPVDVLLAADAYRELSLSPDNRDLLFSSARSGIWNLYTMPLSGGTPQALTHSTTDTLRSIGFFPRDHRVLYSADQGGNELSHIYVREIDGSVRDLTPGSRVRAQFVAWSADQRYFFVVTNERDARFQDLYEYAADGYARRRIFENDKGYQNHAISPDRRTVALSRIVDNANTYTYLYDSRTRKMELLTPENRGIVSEPQVFSADGGSLFYTTNEGEEFAYLARLDRRTGERKTVYKTHWDVKSAWLSKDGRFFVLDIDEDARTTERLLDAKTLAEVSTVDTGSGTIEDFAIARNAPLAALVLADGDMPGDLYTLDLKTNKRSLLLSSLPPAIARKDLVAGEVVRFKSYDGLGVPGILYRPKDAEPRHPGVIFVHGGPGDQSRIGFKPLTQYLVNGGYAVYEVNNRGSSGSGKTFYHLDDRRHGDADLDDVVAARQVLVERAGVDPQRIAVAGGSYGGYITLAALAFRPDTFAAGVDSYGVSNWVRLLQNTPPWWEDLRRLLAAEMGDYDKDADYLRSISPIFHADKIRRPLLVLQGANDPRVLPVESEDIVAKVRANGVPVEYVTFPDEGHGFRKKANQIVAAEKIRAFLDTYLAVAPGDGRQPQQPPTAHP